MPCEVKVRISEALLSAFPFSFLEPIFNANIAGLCGTDLNETSQT